MVYLHNWHSNCNKLEETDSSHKTIKQTYLKQLGVKTGEVKVLGIRWDKQDKI